MMDIESEFELPKSTFPLRVAVPVTVSVLPMVTSSGRPMVSV